MDSISALARKFTASVEKGQNLDMYLALARTAFCRPGLAGLQPVDFALASQKQKVAGTVRHTMCASMQLEMPRYGTLLGRPQ
jgi:hypothetical protein